MNHPYSTTTSGRTPTPHTKALQARIARGAQIASTPKAVAQVSHTAFLVAGSHGGDYHVHLLETHICDCPDYQKNGERLGTCKHIEAAKIIKADGVEQSPLPPAPPCPPFPSAFPLTA